MASGAGGGSGEDGNENRNLQRVKLKSAGGERSSSWCLSRQRNKTVLGTWEERAFQASLRDCRRPEDPLAVPLFHDLLPYHCLPHCGVYGPDEYHVALPLVVISLPGERLLQPGALPHDLHQNLVTKLAGESQLEGYILVHSRPSFEGSLDPHAREVNLMLHTWAFQGLDFTGEEVHITLEMGVFCPDGVHETAQNICEELNGAPVGRMGRRILHMNAQIGLLENVSLHSFFSLARHDDGRMVVAFHVLPSSEELEEKLKKTIENVDAISDLLRTMETLDFHGISTAVHVMKRLILACDADRYLT